jgi:aminopeptidase
MTRSIAVLFLLGATGVASADPAKVDYAGLAERLVTQSANIHAGDLVLITGNVRDNELLEDILVAVRKAGAAGLIAVSSDRIAKKTWQDVPPSFDANRAAFDVKLSELITAQIEIASSDDPALDAQVPPERMVAVGKAYAPVRDLFKKRNIRLVSLDNGLYPTSKAAAADGVSLDELSKIFWDGVNVDYTKLQATGAAVKKRLAAAKWVELTNPNGTKLKMRVEARPVSVSDGVISDDDVKAGGASVQAWLPAGEVFLAPVPGTAEGRVVVDREVFMGKEIRGLELIFKAGKLVSMKAKEGLAQTEAIYKAAGAGKDVFGFLDVGINPNVKLPPQGQLQGFMPAGMVTIGFGNNTWAGGDNNTDLSFAAYIPGSTLKLDGAVLVDKGVLKP